MKKRAVKNTQVRRRIRTRTKRAGIKRRKREKKAIGAMMMKKMKTGHGRG